jgi:hypothetical protein
VSEAQAKPAEAHDGASEATRGAAEGPCAWPSGPAWLDHLRRAVNVLVPLALGLVLIAAAVPLDKFPEHAHEHRETLINSMRKLSLSQKWGMYAPDPARGHSYLEIIAHDVDGGVRPLEESQMVTDGWGTVWAWKRTRRHIWQYTLTRNIEKTHRNRVWYMRGLCVREDRLGHTVDHFEVSRVYRRIRSPERVREGAELLGPLKRTRGQDASCKVEIIREMIEEDRARRGGD